jgi:hypothetical protein
MEVASSIPDISRSLDDTTGKCLHSWRMNYVRFIIGIRRAEKSLRDRMGYGKGYPAR